jgi:hypothetical protein
MTKIILLPDFRYCFCHILTLTTIMKNLLPVFAAIALYGCSVADCIDCTGIDGYPQTQVCRAPYESAQTPSDLPWNEYCEIAVESGCKLEGK